VVKSAAVMHVALAEPTCLGMTLTQSRSRLARYNGLPVLDGETPDHRKRTARAAQSTVTTSAMPVDDSLRDFEGTIRHQRAVEDFCYSRSCNTSPRS
jgi:hypothetical protein